MLKIDDFDEKFITRESFCSIFLSWWLGLGSNMRLIFERMFVFWEGHFSKKIFVTNGVAAGDLGAKIAPK